MREQDNQGEKAPGRIGRAFSGIMPKGIRSPGKLVRNHHLYMPRKGGLKKKAKLF